MTSREIFEKAEFNSNVRFWEVRIEGTLFRADSFDGLIYKIKKFGIKVDEDYRPSMVGDINE